MTSKLEEAAKVAYEAHRQRMKCFSDLPEWEELDELVREGCVRVYIDFLQALKDPPGDFYEALYMSGLDIKWDYGASNVSSGPGEAWNVMIDWMCSDA